MLHERTSKRFLTQNTTLSLSARTSRWHSDQHTRPAVAWTAAVASNTAANTTNVATTTSAAAAAAAVGNNRWLQQAASNERIDSHKLRGAAGECQAGAAVNVDVQEGGAAAQQGMHTCECQTDSLHSGPRDGMRWGE